MTLPKCVMVPITTVVVIGGALYALAMGAVTGYFSLCVGLLFVVAGVVGIITAAVRRKAVAGIYVFSLSLVCLVGLVVNIIGVIDPDFVSTRDGTNFGGLVKWKFAVGPIYFGAALGFMAVFCVPCLVLSVADLCTITPRTAAMKKKKSKGPFGRMKTTDNSKSSSVSGTTTTKTKKSTGTATSGVAKSKSQVTINNFLTPGEIAAKGKEPAIELVSAEEHAQLSKKPGGAKSLAGRVRPPGAPVAHRSKAGTATDSKSTSTTHPHHPHHHAHQSQSATDKKQPHKHRSTEPKSEDKTQTKLEDLAPTPATAPPTYEERPSAVSETIPTVTEEGK